MKKRKFLQTEIQGGWKRYSVAKLIMTVKHCAFLTGWEPVIKTGTELLYSLQYNVLQLFSKKSCA